jgi:hypothetical protein
MGFPCIYIEGEYRTENLPKAYSRYQKNPILPYKVTLNPFHISALQEHGNLGSFPRWKIP